MKHAASLITETPHPLTLSLSQQAQSQLPDAIAAWQAVDMAALDALSVHDDIVQRLAVACEQTWQNDGRVFLLGCGASGRLAVLLEALAKGYAANQVVGLIAGGDCALVRSVEQFEDSVEFGPKQLQQYGFAQQDLLVALSASGTSPFIIAAVEYAAERCQQKPWLVCCNPASALEHLPCYHNGNINPWYLDVGPMALTGSTRLQATTAMALAVGSAVLLQDFAHEVLSLRRWYQRCDLSALIPFIKMEAAAYASDQAVHYQCPAALGLTVLSDTTERAPTFNLTPFNHAAAQEELNAWNSLGILDQQTTQSAWRALLLREPRQLHWCDYSVTDPAYIDGFDLTERAMPLSFIINMTEARMVWRLADAQVSFALHDLSSLNQQLGLKLLLNLHSTIVMARLGLCHGNLMTHLNPSNHKLVRRAVDTVMLILQKRGETIERTVIEERVQYWLPKLQPNQSIIDLCLMSQDAEDDRH